MQNSWNKLILYAIAVGVKNIMDQQERIAARAGNATARKADEPSFAEQYTAAVKQYKKELGL